MSAKKTPKKTITMGRYKGQECTITRKKAREGYVVVNIVEGPSIEIHASLVS